MKDVTTRMKDATTRWMGGLLVAALLPGAVLGAGCALLGGRGPAEEPQDTPADVLPASIGVLLPMLRDELLRREAKDQQARAAWAATGMRDKALGEKMAAVDAENTARMKVIVADFGWPSVAQVGPDAAKAAFLLVQHADADPAFQARCLPMVEAAAKRGELEKQHVALLTDRVRLAQGKKQLYGTQFMQEGGDWVPQPLEDPANVDRRRAAMELMPMAEYKALLLKHYGKPMADPIPPVPKASPAPRAR